MPPEGFASAAGDVYSLGVTLKVLIAGTEVVANSPVRLQMTPASGELIGAMMEPNPQRRIGLDEVLRRLPAIIAAAQARQDEATSSMLGSLAAVLELAILGVVAARGRFSAS